MVSVAIPRVWYHIDRFFNRLGFVVQPKITYSFNLHSAVPILLFSVVCSLAPSSLVTINELGLIN